MLINSERALAYVVTIDEIRPLEGYDRVEYARTNGWWVVISKNDGLKVGDKCVYFEIDSKVPQDDERFKFLEKRNYKIKTQKMCKVYSQGLLMPLRLFPELGDADINTDVTEKLGVKYSVAEDNQRKKTPYVRKKAPDKWVFKNKMGRFLMRYEYSRRLMLFLFARDYDKDYESFPDFVKKTDEERIENLPWKVGDGVEYILTEKIDGTSCTYALRRIRRHKYEFYVCSRNRRLLDPNSDKGTYPGIGNVYWEMAKKYDIERRLTECLESHPELEWVCIQGEAVGEGIQSNRLKLRGRDLYVFNFITSEQGRLDSLSGRSIIESWEMNWVPILGTGKTQDTMEEMKEFADGKSVLNPSVLREGIVYRNPVNDDSFKNVSRKYLMKAGD